MKPLNIHKHALPHEDGRGDVAITHIVGNSVN